VLLEDLKEYICPPQKRTKRKALGKPVAAGIDTGVAVVHIVGNGTIQAA